MEIGVGILGYGFMGRTHTYGLVTMPLFYDPLPFRVKHISVCNPGEAKRLAAEQTGYYRRVVKDYRELIDDPEIDVICVSSPNASHKDQLIAAINAGKHIYCDKPVVATLPEAVEVFDAMRRLEYRAKHQVALQYRFFPATLRAKQLVDEGFLGRVYHYRASYLHASNTDPKRPLQWKSQKSKGGGGSFADMGVHVVDLVSHLIGEVEAINMTCRTVIAERPSAESGKMAPVDTEDAALATLRHKGGAVGVMDISKVATGASDELRFEIHGEKGAIRFNLMEPNWLDVFDTRDAGAPYGGMRGYKRIQCVQQYDAPAGKFPSPKNSIGWLRAHVHCLYGLLESIALDRPAAPSLLDGIRLQQVLAAAYESADQTAWVNVSHPL